MTDLEKAKKLLGEQSLTCAFVKGNWIYKSTQRGIKPLLEFMELPAKESDFSVADRVIGKAAAFLYILLGAGEVYAGVISKPALTVLENAGIKVTYDCLTDAIRNRAGDGFCPMETATLNIEDPGEALEAVLKKLEEIKNTANA